MEWESLKRPQDKEKKEKKEAEAYASLARAGATIASLVRAEMAKARGNESRKKLQTEAWGRELDDLMRKNEEEKYRKVEEEKEGIARKEREAGMLQKLVHLMVRDGVCDGYKGEENWSVGQVNCFVSGVPQNRWNIIVVALERSKFMVRWRWADLLGIYLAELDGGLGLMRYVRIAPDEVEEFSEIRQFLKEKGLGTNVKQQAAEWQSFQLQQAREKEQREKEKNSRSFHKVLTSTELEALERIGDAGGKIHPTNLGAQMGYSTNYARALCKLLGRADYVDFMASGWCVITPNGKEELRRKGKLKREQ